MKFYRKIKLYQKFKHWNDVVKDFIKSFPRSFFVLLSKKKDYIYIAIRPQAGLGDMLRQKSILYEILKLSDKVVFDIYNKKSYQIYKDVPNVRFFMNIAALDITKKRHDIVFNMLPSDEPIIINNDELSLSKQIIKNINENFKRRKSTLSFLDEQKIACGLGKLGDDTLYITVKNCNLNRFSIAKDTKFVTFQYGWGAINKKQDSVHIKAWSINKWGKMLALLKKYTKDKFKIVQVGKNSYHFPEADIDTVDKTSFDELVYIISKSSLHIDCDCLCVHIAKAVNTKSLVLWGPTEMEKIMYEENINICANVCQPCYDLTNNWFECPRNRECMDSIKPDYVAQKAIEYLKTI
ncbi:MAG: hypothetical protein LBI80_04015 [Endomicrobium sp.]|nr:hypothetical protein [Endomicrobium sp.]